jgi:hypothetical protein
VRLTIASLIACLALLAASAPAGGHNTPWKWTQAKADAKLRAGRWAVTNRVELPSIHCAGVGKGTRPRGSRRARALLYRHFDCHYAAVDADASRAGAIRLHVRGRNSFSLTG